MIGLYSIVYCLFIYLVDNITCFAKNYYYIFTCGKLN